ncbi:MAG: hypothetical protein KKG87_03635 [Elusimicrobia bacterium]|nr:hypothetical protein [Elusimicrobiota bacterium]
MQTKIEDVLDQAIDQLNKGKSIHDCLDAYPEYADELAPLLATAQKLQEIQIKQPHVCKLSETIEKVRETAVLMKTQDSKSFLFVPLNTIVRMSVAAGFIFLAVIGVMSFSSRSLPGESWYSIKLFCEKIDLDYLTSKSNKASKHIELADKRLNEVQKVAQARHVIDKNTLHEMHVHTEIALDQVDEYPDEEAAAFLKRIEQLHRRQIGQLTKTQSDFYSERSNMNEINQSIQLCSDRMDWVQQANEGD